MLSNFIKGGRRVVSRANGTNSRSQINEAIGGIDDHLNGILGEFFLDFRGHALRNRMGEAQRLANLLPIFSLGGSLDHCTYIR